MWPQHVALRAYALKKFFFLRFYSKDLSVIILDFFYIDKAS